MVQKKSVLIVEDEEPIREGLVNLFTYHGFEVSTAIDGKIAVKKALSEPYDFIILDIMLPEKDGLTVCHEIRLKNQKIPIIMLTARSSENDIVEGFRLGADDYVTKPFSLRTLIERVHAILRRTQGPKIEKVILLGRMTIHLQNLLGVEDETHREVLFTQREIEIIKFLLQEDQRVKTRDELLENVWGYALGSDFDTRTVDIHIAKLRRKLEVDPKHPKFIVTLRTAGYQIKNAKVTNETI